MSDFDRSLPDTVEVAIVGAGPAGIAAGIALQSVGRRFVILERGDDVERRERSGDLDIASGVGGAGLYSDGKFSFYPSASEVWGVQPRAHLEAAYSWLLDTMREALGVDAYHLPLEGAGDRAPRINMKGLKSYPSLHTTLDARLALIRQWEMALADNLIPRADVLALSPGSIRDSLELIVDRNGASSSLRANAVILAMGRLGPVVSPEVVAALPLEPRRVEIGLRLEQTTESFVFRDFAELDPKIILELSPGIEMRSFCCCRDGEVVGTRIGTTVSVSGRADCPPTGRSNVGFNLRIAPSGVDGRQWRWLERIPTRLTRRVRFNAQHLLFDRSSAERHELDEMLQIWLADLLCDGVRQTFDHLRADLRSADVFHGLSLEGVGSYPETSASLAAGQAVWVAGDLTGRFRGLTAALLSGYICGRSANDYLTWKYLP